MLADPPEAELRGEPGRGPVVRGYGDDEPTDAVRLRGPAHEPANGFLGVAAPPVGGKDDIAELDLEPQRGVAQDVGFLDEVGRDRGPEALLDRVTVAAKPGAQAGRGNVPQQQARRLDVFHAR